MKNGLTKPALFILLCSIILLSSQQKVNAQPLSGVALESDPATVGSEPYMEAVRRFLSLQEPKIIGGKQAPGGAFSWQVSLGIAWVADPFRAHFCGGSVVSDRWIITAAHCMENLTPSRIVVTAGTNRLSPAAIRRNVKRIIMHKHYNPATKNNDIALLELFSPLPLGSQIRTVPLVEPAHEDAILRPGVPLVVTGWGATFEGGLPVRDLRYLDNLPFVERAFCNTPLAYNGRITENMICAGVTSGTRDSCKGDSGGPLTAETETAPKLAGVVSWGDGCARTNKVGVYTRVANYIDWIRDCVAGSLSCNQ